MLLTFAFIGSGLKITAAPKKMVIVGTLMRNVSAVGTLGTLGIVKEPNHGNVDYVVKLYIF